MVDQLFYELFDAWHDTLYVGCSLGSEKSPETCDLQKVIHFQQNVKIN